MKNYLVFDLGGTYIKHGILSADGKILENSKFKTPTSLEELYKSISKIKEESKYQVSGIALSCPGAVNSKTGFIGGVSALPYIHGPNIKRELEELLDLEVHLENDANCAALAEVWLGEAKNNSDVVFIVIGTGVGGAIVKEKKIHKGKNLHAGEFGIMYFESEIGVPGTWGTVSIGQLTKRISEKLGRDIEGIELFNLVEKAKDDFLQKEIEKWYADLAKGILTIQYVYDPEKIIIGGGISSNQLIMNKIQKKVDELVEKLNVATIYPEVKACKFNNNSNLIGALYNFLYD
ncbi:ROK family protein [Candidatus Cetobacterium colombiensis]|uniref:ROK family protein n=1 Tax=Candidatus Cetobacterium colombiensis TaxID=3073100 RepID=A0ABU4W9A4_9FUSO|nr:ROK family protein [Candidatus Cetobacterium colombiensis]MDX8336116.1 ROK family protein [Candidatus Cetobacterium colombiensis]